MSVLTTTSRVTHTAAGTPSEAFSTTFPFLSNAHLRVSTGPDVDGDPDPETVLVEGVNYSVSGAGESSGTVTMITTLTAGHLLRIQRVLPLTQPDNIASQGSFTSAAVMRLADRLLMQLQQINDGAIDGSFVHGNHPNAANGVYHALATTLLPGFMAAADKVELAAIRSEFDAHDHDADYATLVHTHSNATQIADGFMASEDKFALDDHILREADVHGITDTADLATLSGAQTFTGQKTIRIDGNNKFLKLDATGADRSVLAVYRNNNTAGPEWATGTIINSQGAYHSNAWMILSGVMPATPDSDGLYLPRAASSTLASPLSSMLSVWSDLGAGHPAMEVRVAPIGSPGYLAQYFDRDCKFVLSIEETGELQWGAGATHAENDVRLYRDAATSLRTSAAFRADGILTASQHDSVSGAALTLRSRRTADSGDHGFTLQRENQGNDPLLRLLNGDVAALKIDANATLDAHQGLGFNWAWKLGVISGSEAYPGLWFGPNAPSLSNYSFLYDAGTSIVNGPSAVAIRVNNANQIRVGSNTLGLFGATPTTKQTISGDWGGSPAGKALAAALASYGLVTNSTTNDGLYLSDVLDGSTAVVHDFDTTAAIVHADARLAAWRNDGVIKNSLDKDGKLLSIALQTPVTITGSTDTQKIDSIIAQLVAAGIAVDGTS